MCHHCADKRIQAFFRWLESMQSLELSMVPPEGSKLFQEMDAEIPSTPSGFPHGTQQCFLWWKMAMLPLVMRFSEDCDKASTTSDGDRRRF